MAKKFFCKKFSKKGRSPTIFLPKNRKGLSAIITTLILVALVLGATALIWSVINNMIREKMDTTSSCFGSYEKVKINPQYTCYEELSASSYKVHFSLTIGEVNPEKVIISISSEGEVKSYTITNTLESVEGLIPYSGTRAEVELPNENSGKTYIASGFTAKPDLIQIAPVINEKQCDVSDTLSEIEDCSGYADID